MPAAKKKATSASADPASKTKKKPMTRATHLLIFSRSLKVCRPTTSLSAAPAAKVPATFQLNPCRQGEPPRCRQGASHFSVAIAKVAKVPATFGQVASHFWPRCQPLLAKVPATFQLRLANQFSDYTEPQAFPSRARLRRRTERRDRRLRGAPSGRHPIARHRELHW